MKEIVVSCSYSLTKDCWLTLRNFEVVFVDIDTVVSFSAFTIYGQSPLLYFENCVTSIIICFRFRNLNIAFDGLKRLWEIIS